MRNNTLKNRVLSVLLALVMVLSMLPVSVFAESATRPAAVQDDPAARTPDEAPAAATEAATGTLTEAPTEAPAQAPIAVYAADHVHKKDFNGNCPECEQIIIATVSSFDTDPVYCTTMAEALEASKSGAATINMDASTTLTAADALVVDHKVRINLNGYTIDGDGSITVNYTPGDDDSVGLYISDSGTLDVPVTVSAAGSMEVYGEITFGRPLIVSGKMHFEGDGAKLGAVSVSDSAALTVKGDTSIDSLTIGEHAKVQLSGGTYGGFNAPEATKVGDLLASGYVFKTATGALINPNVLLSALNQDSDYPVSVIPCGHETLTPDGTCYFCGALAEAKIGDQFFGTFGKAVAYANEHPGSTIVLQSNVSIPGTATEEDLPYITANTTLELNGKTLDMVMVGKPMLDEDGEVASVTPGALTVNGDGYISNAITLYGGALTITGGEVQTLELSAYAPCTVSISGGEIAKLSTLAYDDAAIDVTVSGGTVKNVSSSAGTITFNGHTEAAEGGTIPSWYVSSGKVIVNGGTFRFTLLDCTGSLILNGGTFSTIEMSLYGSTTTLADLLGDGRAFYGEDGKIIKADELTKLTNVTVKEHTHPGFTDNGKCPECGAPCKHTTVDENGKCTGCGAQFKVSLQVGDNISYHASFEAAIDAAPRNMSDPVTITLLADLPACNIFGSRNITLDMNGKHLLGDTVTVNNHCKLTLTGSFDEFSLPLIVNGDENGTGELDRTGILVIDPTDSKSVVGSINAKDASRVTVLGGTIESLYIQATDTEKLSYIDLAGGTYKDISFPNINGNVTLTDLLAPGCAFRCDEAFTKYEAGALIDYGFRLDAKTLIENLSVVPCEHPSVNEWRGYCAYCGKLYAAKITTADGTEHYLETLTDDDVLSAAGGTVKLLQDVNAITVNQDCTIELNGHKLLELTAHQADKITVRGTGLIDGFYLGYSFRGDTHATTLVLEEVNGQSPKINYLCVNKTTAETKLTCGTFSGISFANDDGVAADLLAEGYAFANRYGAIVNGYKNRLNEVTVTKHTHEFTKNAEGLDECACGVTCAHETIGEDGKCTNCHYQMYVAFAATAGGKKLGNNDGYFSSLEDAWKMARQYTGAKLKLLCDVTLDGTSEYFLASSNDYLTFDLNGKTLEADAQGYIFKITDNANLTIKNGKIYNTFYYEPSQTQFFYGNGNAVSVANGGTAVLENLELSGGEGGSDDNYVKPCPIALTSSGNLTVTGCTLHGTLLMWVFDNSATTVQIASTKMYGGIDYIGLGTEKAPELIRSFFAEGNMLLTDEGKYIDLADEAYWKVGGEGSTSYVSFTYSDSAMVVPHSHTYAKGFCSSCGAGCDHSGDDHSHKASYFQQAVCSVCGASYGELEQDKRTPDITAEGDLPVMDYADAQNVTYDRYINGSVTIRFTLSDDSYTQEGFDPAKHSVKLYYWITDKAVDVGGDWTFKEAFKDGYFSLVTDDQITFTPPENSDGETRIIYLFAEDARGNRRYVTTNGFTIDLSKPEISLVSPVAEALEEGKTYDFCQKQVVLQVTEAHLDTLEASEGATVTQQADGNYLLTKNPGLRQQTITLTATDKAGNKTQVTITLHDSHNFNEANVCTQCGEQAVAMLSMPDKTTMMFASGDELFDVLAEETYDGAAVTLLQDTNITTGASVKSDVTIDLNGKKLGTDSNSGIAIYGEVTICSSGSAGDILTTVAVRDDAQLTMGEGLGNVRYLILRGKTYIHSGDYLRLDSFLTPTAGAKEVDAATEAALFQLYGGHFSNIALKAADIRDILAKGYRFEGMTYADAIGTTATNVTVIPCEHAGIPGDAEPVCPGCGLEVYASVQDGTETFFFFDSFEAAIRCAEAHEGSVLTLCRNIELNKETAGSLLDGGYYRLTTGKYSIKLDGLTLTVVRSCLVVEGNCDLTITSYGNVNCPDSDTGAIEVRAGAHLTVEGGDFTLPLTAYGTDTLTLKGGSFQQIVSEPNIDNRKSCSPLEYLADGSAFQLENGKYANESNVKTDKYVAGRYYINEKVTVVSAPMSITTQPKHVSLYVTSPAEYRPEAEVTVACVLDGASAEEVTATLVKDNGDEVVTKRDSAAEAVRFAFSTESITAEDRGMYRIKLEYRGYALYSESFYINVTQCDHVVPIQTWTNRQDKSTCPTCHCDIAAAIRYNNENGVTRVACYVNAADAFAAAQTDAYTDCMLTLVRDCTENLTVKTGSFLLNTTNKCKMQGNIRVEQGAKLGIIGDNGSTINSAFAGDVTCAGELTVDYAVFTGEKFRCDKGSKVTIKNATIGGNITSAAGATVEVERTTIRGNVICAKGGKITAWPATIKGTVNCLGEGNFTYVTFEKDVSGKGGSNLKLTNCELKAGLNVSGTARLTGVRATGVPSVSGVITVNNGGNLEIFGSDCTTMLVKSDGKASTYSDTEFTDVVTLESGSTMEMEGGTFAKLAALSGSTLTVQPAESGDVEITNAEIGDVKGAANATFYAGVTFGHLSVNGQRPIDCLAEGLGYWDNAREEITDGRNQILSNVTVVTHEHDCVWKTTTHEKLCGCGYVAATDTAAPVISGVENGKTYYGAVSFTLTDANDFTVTIDGQPASETAGSYIIEPDNQSHVITATDIAGNTTTVTISVMKIYRVTLSSGTGYTITGEPLAKHGEDYTFTVELAEGYSKTDSFMVDVNGRPLYSDTESYTYEMVESELHITVFGVADITPPDAEITIGKNSFKSFLNTVTFGLFFKSTQTVTVTASDAGSGLKTVEYLLSETAFESKDAITGDWTALELENGTASFSIAPKQKAFVYVRVTDESGNIAVINSEGVVVYTDAEARRDSVTYVMGSSAEAYLPIDRNDNRISAVYNGTQKLTENDDYTCYAYSDAKLRNSYLRTLAAGEYTIRVTFDPMKEAYIERDGNEAPAEVTIKLIVAKKTPTIDHKLEDGKTYDGNPIGAPTYNTDSDGAVTFEYKPADADNTAYTTTAPKDAGRYIIRISVAENDTFKAASSLMNFKIFPKDVTISGAAAANKVYDATTAAEISNVGTLVGVVGDDKVSIVPGTAAFDDKNVGTGKAVTFTGFTITGDDAENYELSAQPTAGTADITAKEVTIEGASVEPTKVYDGTAEAKLAATGTLSEICDGDELTFTAGTVAYDDKNVGTGKIVTFSGFALTGRDAANYTLAAQPASVTADITVKEIIIVGATVEASKVYDGTTAAKVSSAGTPSENFDGENLTVKTGTAAYDNKNVGVGKTVTFTGFELAGKEAGNYLLTAQPAAVTADITAKEVTITGATVEASKVYDGTTAATITSAGTLSANFDGEALAITPGTANYDNKNVGVGKTVTFTGFALTGDEAGNYTLTAQPAAVTADITAKEVTIEGASVEPTKVYDGTAEAKLAATGTLSEICDGDELTFTAGTVAYDDKNVGTGKIVTFSGFALTGRDAANYTLAAQPASVTADITVKEIIIVGATVEASKVYDGTTAAKVSSAGTPSENFDGENLTVKTGTAAYDNKNVGVGKTVTFTGFELAGKEAGNYLLTAQPAAVTADITAKEVTITGATVEASKVYDGTTAATITSAGTLSANFDGENLRIETGTAAYDNKNVGVGKTVTFTGFTLTGDEAGNYLLTAQPADTTANITAKTLTIDGLKVRDKQYDGTTAATIDGTPTLVGVADRDTVQLLNGIPTFESEKIGKDIPIHFTAFALFGDADTIANYKLTQPTGITASIVEYLADGTEYRVNSNDWINTDFVVTAADGWLLGRSDAADGAWTQQLTASDETADGSLTFYVRNAATGVISAAVTEHYKIDKTCPTGTVALNERSAFQTILNKISFDLLFNQEVNVKLTADDDASGVKSVLYYKSDKVLNEDAVRALTDWTDNTDFNIPAEDMAQFIIYVCIEDNAGNVTYIGSDGATFDTTAPEVVGVENGKTYYVTKRVAVDDENPGTVTLNDDTVGTVFSLAGDRVATYIIHAVDEAGNETTVTVTMKPISSITDAIAAITADNVKSSDAAAIAAVERQLLDIAETFDDEESTPAEWQQLVDGAANCKALTERIAAVAAEIDRITAAVNGYDIATVTSDDKAALEQLLADIDALLATDNLTQAERDALEALKDQVQALLDRIAAAKAAAEAPEIVAVKDITKDNVKPKDKEALEKAQEAIEEALRTYGDNYTEAERKALEEQLEAIKAALAALDNAEKAAEAIDALPKPEDAKLGDKDEAEKVKELVDGLTEHEKELVGKDALGKLDDVLDRIAALEKISFAPSIIEGAGQTWYESTGKNARFRSNAEFDEFRKVLVDGKELSKDDYTAYAGSTVVELKAAYLKSLSGGKHSFAIVSANGTAGTTFTVVKAGKPGNPQTGRDSSLTIWVALLALSGGAALTVAAIGKKKKHPDEP